jgi:Protein of unknown function (DUF4058)
MPSPIPGMDPFLEDSAVFPDLHDSLITELRNAINAQLPPPYYASSASRVWVEPSQRRVEPDVNVLRPERPGSGAVTSPSVATVVARPPVVVRIPREEFRQTYLDVYAKPGHERLVTTIEVLSPTNKAMAGEGRTLYLQKQREVLGSKVNLVEIDLLRGGQHTTVVRLEDALAKAGPFDYHVCVCTFEEPEDFVIYPASVGERLPIVAIPLLPGDGSVSIDLQVLLDRCYDTGLYLRRVPYAERTPVSPLRPEQAAWVEQVLRTKGILPPATVPVR